MKMNWGKKIMIVYISFVVGMLILVWVCVKQRMDLVSADYYPRELKFQQQIDASGNAAALSQAVSVVKLENEIRIQLPREMKNKNISGQIWFYCPSNARNDVKMPLQVNMEGVQNVAASEMKPGAYIVKIDWEADQKHFYSENKIYQ
jgi:nitrogen fixation protein FixH